MARKKRITKKVLFQKTVEILQPILNLTDWKIVVIFSYSKRMKATATCESFSEYKLAKIRMNHGELTRLTHNEIVSTAIHEMIHCILWDLGEWAHRLSKKDPEKIEITRRYEEGAVTAFEKILIPLITDQLNEVLKQQGYYGVDLTFTDFEVHHDR